MPSKSSAATSTPFGLVGDASDVASDGESDVASDALPRVTAEPAEEKAKKRYGRSEQEQENHDNSRAHVGFSAGALAMRGIRDVVPSPTKRIGDDPRRRFRSPTRPFLEKRTATRT